MFRPMPFGKYYLYERLAVGGMAEIFKAKLFGVDGFEKNMVVKQILPQFSRNHEFVQMFIDEAKISVSLSHGNIVPVYELGQIDGLYFISMECVDGKNLGELLDAGIESQNTLSVPHALFITSEILSGLDYAHRKTDERGRPLHIVHRDVSPQNILISFEGEVKIVDFGIARAAIKAHFTEAGVIKGKFGYMSPEQALGMEVDARSDIFCTGILLYEMLTLQRLFRSETDVVTLERVKRADVPIPSRVNPNLSPQLDAIIFKALERNPITRYQSAGEMRLAVSRFLYQLPEEASSKTLSAYTKRMFAHELLKRQSQSEITLPPSEVESSWENATADQRSLPGAMQNESPRPLGPEVLFSPQAIQAPLGHLGQAKEPIPWIGQGEDVEDNFSYRAIGKKLKWLLIFGLAVILVGGIFLFRTGIGELFSIFGEAMDKSVERLVQKDLGTLLVRSRPSGATVYFDNRMVGTTNMRISSIDPAREYELVLTLEGYPPWSRSILPTDWTQGEKMVIHVFKDWTSDSLK